MPSRLLQSSRNSSLASSSERDFRSNLKQT